VLESETIDKIPTVRVLNLGLVGYESTWDQQKLLHTHLVNRKRFESYRASLTAPLDHEHYFIICEHPSVFTLGKSGSEANLLKSFVELKEQGIDYYKINRGGDITYHGPGQVVGYPILDLDAFFTDVHKYVRFLEEIIIRVLATYGVQGYREKDFTGVWVNFDLPPTKRKICAIGVHLSRWVTMHGFAFNINNDLTPFGYMIPCGIDDPDRGVCSLSQILGMEIEMNELNKRIMNAFQSLFNCRIVDDQKMPEL